MLDKRTSALLQSINDFCSSGTYKIFSEEDFLADFPQQWGVTAESENGYINVKYSGGGMYCICPLPLGRGYCEQEAEKRSDCVAQLKYFMSAAFFGAFAGAVLGALVFAVVFLIMR